MLKFIENFTNEHVLEHDLEHDLTQKIKFSDPKIYHANKDISKRWYVYFSYRNPETGKMQRMQNIYGKANSFKTKEDRLAVLSTYRRVLIKLLKEGFNPYEDNSVLIEKRKQKTIEVKEDKIPQTTFEEPKKESSTLETVGKPIEEEGMLISEALSFGLKLKEKTLRVTSYRSFSNRIKRFETWMSSNNPNIKEIKAVKKIHVIEFLNDMLTGSSSRNRNNFRVDLSSMFQLLYDNEIVDGNFVKPIPVLKTKAKRNRTFNKAQEKEIVDYLEVQDPTLLLFVRFVSYNLLRPIEVCRLKVKDLDLEHGKLYFVAKNSERKTKIIPEVMQKALPDLSQLNPDMNLFTPQGIGGNWELHPDNKRGYFTKRFKKVVKDKFDLDENYGLYSFRHTYITKLYRELAKTYSPFEAKSRLMQITGHSTMDALESYLRDIDAELPSDYSHLIKAQE